MKRTLTITKDVYYSTIVKGIETEDPQSGEVIEWADANPVVWKIVTQTKSKAFGKGSDRGSGDTPLHLACVLKGELERTNTGRAYSIDFWVWRARFTLERYGEKGFTGGFFQQFDGSYPRGCHYLDYTPATLETVLDAFYKHCDTSSCRYETRELWVDKVVRRTVGGPLSKVEREMSERARGTAKAKRAVGRFGR